MKLFIALSVLVTAVCARSNIVQTSTSIPRQQDQSDVVDQQQLNSYLRLVQNNQHELLDRNDNNRRNNDNLGNRFLNIDETQRLAQLRNNDQRIINEQINESRRLERLRDDERIINEQINESRRLERLRDDERILNEQIQKSQRLNRFRNEPRLSNEEINNELRTSNLLRNDENILLNIPIFESQRLRNDENLLLNERINENQRLRNEQRLIQNQVQNNIRLNNLNRNNDLRNLRGDEIVNRRNEQLRVAGQLATNQLQGIQESNGAGPLLTRTRLAQTLANVGPQGVAAATSSNLRLNNNNNNNAVRDDFLFRTSRIDLNNENRHNNKQLSFIVNEDGQQLYPEQYYIL